MSLSAEISSLRNTPMTQGKYAIMCCIETTIISLSGILSKLRALLLLIRTCTQTSLGPSIPFISSRMSMCYSKDHRPRM